MNETIITLNGQTYIIPASRVSELLSWLRSNAVQAGQKSSLGQQNEKANDPRQLLFEMT